MVNPNNNKPLDPPLKRFRVGDYAFIRVRVTDYHKNPLSFDDNPVESDAVVVPVNRLGQAGDRHLYVREQDLVSVDDARRAMGGGR